MDRNGNHRPELASAPHLIQHVASLLVPREGFVQGQIYTAFLIDVWIRVSESKRITMDPVRASSLRGFQIRSSSQSSGSSAGDCCQAEAELSRSLCSWSSSAGKISSPRDSCAYLSLLVLDREGYDVWCLYEEPDGYSAAGPIRGREYRPRDDLTSRFRSLSQGSSKTLAKMSLSCEDPDFPLRERHLSYSVLTAALTVSLYPHWALQIGLHSSISVESMMRKMFDDSDPTVGLTSNWSISPLPSSPILPGFNVTGIQMMFGLDEWHKTSKTINVGETNQAFQTGSRTVCRLSYLDWQIEQGETTNLVIVNRRWYETISTQHQRWRDEKWTDTEWRSTFSWRTDKTTALDSILRTGRILFLICTSTLDRKRHRSNLSVFFHLSTDTESRHVHKHSSNSRFERRKDNSCKETIRLTYHRVGVPQENTSRCNGDSRIKSYPYKLDTTITSKTLEKLRLHRRSSRLFGAQSLWSDTDAITMKTETWKSPAGIKLGKTIVFMCLYRHRIYEMIFFVVCAHHQNDRKVGETFN